MTKRLARLTVSAILALSMLLFAGTPPANAGGPILVGAGSTWSEIAIDQWRGDVYRYGLQINYQGVGSTTGRQFFIADTVDFAVSEIPFQPEDGTFTRKYAYLPIVAGGTSLMYNLHSPSGAQIRNLQLSSATIAGIMTGQITNWNDPRITARRCPTCRSKSWSAPTARAPRHSCRRTSSRCSRRPGRSSPRRAGSPMR
jgi:phosphate transport system substrate-binding protein